MAYNTCWGIVSDKSLITILSSLVIIYYFRTVLYIWLYINVCNHCKSFSNILKEIFLLFLYELCIFLFGPT